MPPRPDPAAKTTNRDDTINQILTATQELKKMYFEIKQTTEAQLLKQDEILAKLQQNTQDVKDLKMENQKLKSRLATTEEELNRAEQYSRKDVLIITGLGFEDNETDKQLQTSVIGMFNDLLKRANKGYELSMLDFCAIHRNGRKMRNNRPPSITVKFLRFFEKDMLFDKAVVRSRKTYYPGINFFHCMSKGMIEVQRVIEQNNAVKFCKFEAGGYFSVCLLGENGQSDSWLNRIYSVEQFKTKLGETIY